MNSFRIPRIDRKDELELLHQIVTGRISHRVLTIKAGPGMGKSELLREFISNRPENIAYAVVDFKNRGISPASFLYNICESLGWQYFPKLENLIDSLLVMPNIKVSENFLVGQNQISVVLGKLDVQDRGLQLVAITKAFFDDLRYMNRVVFIVDTFEKADPIIQDWLANVFLPYSANVPNLVFIISGQSVPEPTIELIDICIDYELKGIEAVHWYNYARSVGITVSLSWVEGCCFAISGHPLQMAQILSSFPRGDSI